MLRSGSWHTPPWFSPRSGRPPPLIDNVWAMMYVWRWEGRLSDYQNCSVLYCVLKLCTVISTLKRAVLTVLWIGFCHTVTTDRCKQFYLLRQFASVGCEINITYLMKWNYLLKCEVLSKFFFTCSTIIILVSKNKNNWRLGLNWWQSYRYLSLVSLSCGVTTKET